MSREEIIRMARGAGFCLAVFNGVDGDEVVTRDGMIVTDELERFAALVAAAKKEECAKEAEGITKFIKYQSKEHYKFASVIAAAIRAM